MRLATDDELHALEARGVDLSDVGYVEVYEPDELRDLSAEEAAKIDAYMRARHGDAKWDALKSLMERL